MLTKEALHNFIREEGYDLFGEERGRVQMDHIKRYTACAGSGKCEFSVAVAEGSKGKEKTVQLKAPSTEVRDEWVAAIQACATALPTPGQPGPVPRPCPPTHSTRHVRRQNSRHSRHARGSLSRAPRRR